MLISQALAHGASGVENPSGGFGPLIILGVAVVFVLVLLAEKKWRRRKPGHHDKSNVTGESSRARIRTSSKTR